jgi:hypothetical protein
MVCQKIPYHLWSSIIHYSFLSTGIIISQLIPSQTLHLFLLRSILISLLLIWIICPGLFILLRVCKRICKCLRSSLTFHNMLVDLQWSLSVQNPTLKLKDRLPTTAGLFNTPALSFYIWRLPPQDVPSQSNMKIILHPELKCSIIFPITCTIKALYSHPFMMEA